MSLTTLISIAIAFVLLWFFFTAYNGLVALKNQVSRSWGNIEVILKQRHDEIPQLIEILEQYVDYEKSVIQSLVDARKSYSQARSFDEKTQASSQVTRAVTQVLAVGEGYPELKSNENFVQLQGRISLLEEELSHRREHFNETVTNFNTRIEQIPDIFVAKFLGYQSYQLYQISAQEREKPNLKLNIKK